MKKNEGKEEENKEQNIKKVADCSSIINGI